MTQAKVIVIDDDPQIRDILYEFLTKHEYDVDTAADGLSALSQVEKDNYQVAIVDLDMPGLTGMETIHRLNELKPDMEVVIFTGNPTYESSVDAIHEHVFAYLCKPADLPVIRKTIQNAVERHHLIIKNRDLLQELEAERNKLKYEVKAAKRAIEHRLQESPIFVGQSKISHGIRHQVASVAPSPVNVLLLGESGVGKDVVSQLIHESSGRAPDSFFKINCPAIPESLLESELFGHEAGAFTGAVKRKPGRFELAEGGTLFLDEIGDLPFSLQSKLLQAVEQKQFYSVGGKKPISIDVRIIAATNAPLEKMIDEGKFRADLYYRLNEYAIEIPPLRERKEDIFPLVNHFLEEYRKQFDAPERDIPPNYLTMIEFYDWPGNVRELQSQIRRFVLTGEMSSFAKTFQAFGNKKSNGDGEGNGKGKTNMVFPIPDMSPRPPINGGDDAQKVLQALIQSRWNRRKAAITLGISYSTLRRRIAEYELDSI